jgi:integrase
MEWGDIPPLRTEVIRLAEGDLFVHAVNKYGLQTDNATLYCSVVLRPTSMSLATMQARMDAICHFHNWCGPRDIDFLQRLESGEFFQQHELAGLRQELRRNLRKGPAPGKPIKLKKKRKTTVGTAHWRNRCVAVRDYVVWYGENVIQRLSVRDERLPEMRARLADFAKNLVAGIKVRRNPMREGLSEEQEPVLIAAITPADASNPFAPRNHPRNEALWLTFFDGGLRLGEAIGLKTIDCQLNGPKKRLIVHRRPDDPEDPRLKQALTKTLPHPVEIGSRLARVMHDYIVNHRPSYPGAKRSPYVFLSEDGGPLTHATVAYMYGQLREKVPGLPKNFSTNDARRSWNNRFAVGAEQAGGLRLSSLSAIFAASRSRQWPVARIRHAFDCGGNHENARRSYEKT